MSLFSESFTVFALVNRNLNRDTRETVLALFCLLMCTLNDKLVFLPSFFHSFWTNKYRRHIISLPSEQHGLCQILKQHNIKIVTETFLRASTVHLSITFQLIEEKIHQHCIHLCM